MFSTHRQLSLTGGLNDGASKHLVLQLISLCNDKTKSFRDYFGGIAIGGIDYKRVVTYAPGGIALALPASLY
jgi:hypothetical protein